MRKRWKIAAVAAGIAALVGCAWGLKSLYDEWYLSKVRVVSVDWRHESIWFMRASFVLENDNPFDVTDIEVLCRHTDEAGKEIDQNRRTLARVVPAQGKLDVSEYNMGFMHVGARGSTCRVTNYRKGSVPTPIE